MSKQREYRIKLVWFLMGFGLAYLFLSMEWKEDVETGVGINK